MKAFWMLAAVAALPACSTMSVAEQLDQKVRRVSVGQTGCYPEEMAVRELRPELGLTTWQVECQDKLFLCSADLDDRISCAERAQPATGATAARR